MCSKANKLRVKLFSIGTDTAKQMIYSRLKIHQPGAGYCHFPSDYPEEYFKQLTAERIQTKFVNGHPSRIWVMPKGRRNEALDAWIAADLAVAKGQSYSMNGRSLTLANTREIREQIQYWERRVSAFTLIIQNNQQAALADFLDV